ncbi:MAG: hypothetical protein J4F42_05040 [Desulfurellaceae bacterium]|nr:hypothetical protein [Desulfurellaceae bacterium]
MNSQAIAAIEEHVFTYAMRQPFEQRRRPGPLLLYDPDRPSKDPLRSLLARQFPAAFADLEEDQAWAARAGIWAGAFVAPWAWRRGQRLD